MTILANNIIQQPLEEGGSWHEGVFALFMFALLIHYVAFLHTGGLAQQPCCIL